MTLKIMPLQSSSIIMQWFGRRPCRIHSQANPSTRRMPTPTQHPLSYPKIKQAWRTTKCGSLSQINLDLSYSEQLYWHCKSIINRNVDSHNSILCMVGSHTESIITIQSPSSRQAGALARMVANLR